MKEVSINILVHERPHFLDITFETLKNIKEKENIQLNVLFTQHTAVPNRNIIQFVIAMADHGIDTKALGFVTPAPQNFMEKIQWMVDRPEPFCIRVDDDCFAPTKVWDHLIAKRKHLAENKNILAIAPCITNGMPTVDYWRETFLSTEERAELDKMILANPILEKWTNDYSNLALAFETSKWNPDLYNSLLFENGDDRLGLHPVRFNLDIQKWINEKVLEHWNKFINPPCVKSEIVSVRKRPYFCNTCFIIKTNDYKTIIEDSSLKRDAFEEITFNLFRRHKFLQLEFLTDAWMLNLFFRSVGNSSLENMYAEKVREKL